MVLEIILPVVGVLLVGYFLLKPKYNHPPGPTPWPLLGNLLNLPRPLFVHATNDLKKKYGDIISFTFGMRRFIILNSYSVIKEALTGPQADIFSGRINSEYILSITQGKGIVGSEGNLWKEHRRFALKALKDFGFARQGTEDACHVELEDLRKRFDDNPTHEFETGDLIGRTIASVISVLLFNYRAGYSDKKFDDFMMASQENLQGSNKGRFIPSAYPFLMKIPGALHVLQALGVDVFVLKRNSICTYDFCITQINKHRETIKDISEPRDFVDAFLLEQMKQENGNKSHTFDDFQLTRTLTDLFIAGTDTTANTLRWSLLYAALHPDIQENLFSEIQQSVGTSRLPVMSDRKNLQYLQAFIDEVQRYSTLAPFSVHHRATELTKLGGYDITPDDFILVNLYGVHHDPELWDKPEKFNPDRFLNFSESKSGVYQTSEYMVPFGLGRRSCLGESLARQELFLFLAGIFQSHRVELVDTTDLDKILIGSEGLVHAPLEHKLRFLKRT